MEMIDSRGGDWLQSTATSVYNLAQRLLENKTRRPKITEVSMASTPTSVYNLAQRLLANKTRRPKITEVSMASTATSVYNLAQRLLANKTRRPKIIRGEFGINGDISVQPGTAAVRE